MDNHKKEQGNSAAGPIAVLQTLNKSLFGRLVLLAARLPWCQRSLQPQEFAGNFRVLMIIIGRLLDRSPAVVRPGEAVNKSAASAASTAGFSSRDPVGC